jgi:hypothetical protein
VQSLRWFLGSFLLYGYCTAFYKFYKDKKTVVTAASVDFRKTLPTCIIECV